MVTISPAGQAREFLPDRADDHEDPGAGQAPRLKPILRELRKQT
jgi:hypothetical protein